MPVRQQVLGVHKRQNAQDTPFSSHELHPDTVYLQLADCLHL